MYAFIVHKRDNKPREITAAVPKIPQLNQVPSSIATTPPFHSTKLPRPQIAMLQLLAEHPEQTATVPPQGSDTTRAQTLAVHRRNPNAPRRRRARSPE